MASLATYCYKVELSFIETAHSKEFTIIDKSIQYIVLDYEYIKYNMPIIYIVVKLDAAVYELMQRAQNTNSGMVTLTLKRRRKKATHPIDQIIIQDQFNYYITDDPNENKKMDDNVKGKGVAFKKTTIGLIKKKLIGDNNKSFNGVYKNTTPFDLVKLATKDLSNVIIEPFTNNPTVANLMIPPTPTIMQFISYVNAQYSFYNSPFIFFMDFDKIYLKSNSGKYVDVKEQGMPYIAIDIRDMASHQAHLTGIVSDPDQDAYLIYINKTNAQVFNDRETADKANVTISVTADGKSETTNIDTSILSKTDESIGSKIYIKQKEETSGSSEMATNTIIDNMITLKITKSDMDISIFTPNKEYLVSKFENDDKYTGRYFLVSKKIVLVQSGIYFDASTTLELRMVLHY